MTSQQLQTEPFPRATRHTMILTCTATQREETSQETSRLPDPTSPWPCVDLGHFWMCSIPEPRPQSLDFRICSSEGKKGSTAADYSAPYTLLLARYARVADSCGPIADMSQISSLMLDHGLLLDTEPMGSQPVGAGCVFCLGQHARKRTPNCPASKSQLTYSKDDSLAADPGTHARARNADTTVMLLGFR